MVRRGMPLVTQIGPRRRRRNGRVGPAAKKRLERRRRGATLAAMEQAELIAWSVLIGGYALPLAHVLLSPAAGRWTPPPGSRCPLGPRVGWLVMVLLLGPIGWLLFATSRRRAQRG